MRVSTKTRELVVRRDHHACVCCGGRVRSGQVHHRTPRGMGGTKLAAANLPGNLILGCAHCHLTRWESDRDWAYRLGYLVHRGTDPLTVPVYWFHSWVLLDNTGGKRYI